MSRVYTERVVLSAQAYSDFWGKTWEMQLDDVYSVPNGSELSGGAICTADSVNSVTLKTADGDGLVYFIGNTTTKNGGAVYVAGGTCHEIKNAVFYHNQSALGGAVYNLAGQLLTIENSLFLNNISTQSGALASQKECLVVNTIFSDNKSTGDAGTHTYDSGALYVFDWGKVTVKDCYFSGNTGADSRCGAIANKQATLVFQGENILATETDTIFAYQGNIIFDISDKTTPESVSKAVLNHFDYISVYNMYGDFTTFKVNVSSNQRNDIYVIANDASKAGTAGYGNSSHYFQLTVDNAGATNIAVNGAAVKDGKYALKKTAANDLVLVVGGNFLFVNNEYLSWDQEESRLAVYRGVEFWGVEDDRSHFIAFQEAVARGLEQGMKDNCKLVGVDEGDVNYSVELKGVTSDLTSGNFKRLVVGGAVNAAVTTSGTNLMISGGTYNSNVIGSDYVSGGKTLEETKASTLEITGGTFEKAIAGGMYAYTGNAGTKATLSVGEGNTAVNMVISGGTFNGRIYGGNYATDDTSAKATNSNINGDISITIDCNKSAIEINNGITVGSRGKGKIVGNTTLTFTGNGDDNLTFDGESEVADIWGGSNLDTRLFKSDKWVRNSSSVSGHSALVFDNFKKDNFNATFGLFTDLKVTKGSDVTFTNADLDTSDVKNWLIEAGCSLAGLQKNDFEGDTLALYGVAGETLISGTADADSFANLNLATSVLINGKECSYAEGCWASSEIGLKLVIVENSLKLAAYTHTLA